MWYYLSSESIVLLNPQAFLLTIGRHPELTERTFDPLRYQMAQTFCLGLAGYLKRLIRRWQSRHFFVQLFNQENEKLPHVLFIQIEECLIANFILVAQSLANVGKLGTDPEFDACIWWQLGWQVRTWVDCVQEFGHRFNEQLLVKLTDRSYVGGYFTVLIQLFCV